LDLSKFDTSHVTNMSYMFFRCSNLTKLDLSNFNTSNVTNMSDMFGKCSNLTKLDLSNFNTSNVTNMSAMFEYCTNLTNVNLSSFNTSMVYSMMSMFERCTNLTELDLSSFDTSKISNMNFMFFYCNNLWKITMGKQFKIKDDAAYCSPTAPSSATSFLDDGKKYISSGDEKWQAVNSEDGGTVHKPKGEIFTDKSFPEQRKKDGQETYVWKHQLFNEAPKIEIDKDSVKEGVKYPYVEDYRKSENLLPPFEITGKVSDSDSDSVSIYYTIDKEIDPNDPDQLNTIGRPSASVDSEEKINNVKFNVKIQKDDLKILATPKKGGHKIWIYARDGGSQGAKDNSKLSDPKQCWIAENGIIDFKYIGPEGKMLKQPKTLVKIINTETNISEENPDYYSYMVSDYLPKSIWTSSTRYSLSEFPSDLESLRDNKDKDRGRIPSTIKENDIIRTVKLNYYLAGQVSLKQVPSLDFGSHVSQNVLQGDQLNLQHDAKQKLIVNDTTQRNTTDPNWQLSLEIKPLKDGIGVFRYYKDGNNYVDVSNFSNIASSEDTDLDTRDAATGKETNISNNWWDTKDNKQIKGPKLVLNQVNPPAGKYVTEATWNIENVPL
ncbi:MAG: BspA family leucine-rich repeat surface protein, partial [Leuconostoc suionicum]|uniref:BspA family leucine-rich repeat surface protein n=1 Tax=Leuconostoc suionicum TaxID=1511761 RepID=UPI003F3E297B